MQSKRGELIPVGKIIGGLGGPVKAIRDASPQALRHFTRFDQVNQLVSASEADPDLGFMARMMALCSCPAPTPAIASSTSASTGRTSSSCSQAERPNSPMATFPACCWPGFALKRCGPKSRELILGSSLSEFMRKLGMAPVGGVRTRLRNQMRRLFNAHVQLVYEDERGEASVSSSVADRTEFWWNERKPDEQVLWDSKIRLGEDFFNEIINHPVPIDMNTLTALKRCALGLDLYLWLTYRTFALTAPATAHLASGLPSVRSDPGTGER